MLDKVCKEKKLKIKPILKENTPEISKSQYGRHVLMQLDKVKAKWICWFEFDVYRFMWILKINGLNWWKGKIEGHWTKKKRKGNS